MKSYLLRLIVTVMIVVVLVYAIIHETKNAKLSTLNHFMPSSYAGLLNQQEIPRYIRYYYLIYFLTPAKADALAMLGFCYISQGQWDKAQVAYEKALQMNPNLWWGYRNLALVYMHAGQSSKASELMHKASTVNVGKAIEAMMSSRIYVDIGADLHLTPPALIAFLIKE